jgi:L-amino acid N-acyltransferase YncA
MATVTDIKGILEINNSEILNSTVNYDSSPKQFKNSRNGFNKYQRLDFLLLLQYLKRR